MQLSAAGGRYGVWLAWLVLAGACTKDFSRFQFHDVTAGRDSGPITSGDSGRDAQANQIVADSSDPYAGRSGMDATGGAGKTAKPDGAAEAGKQSMSKDAGMHQRPDDDDAQVRGGAGGSELPPDAGPPPPPTDSQQCVAAYVALQDDRAACRTCTCEQCTDPALDCLNRADAYERMACTELWKCAIASGCHDWDCYCSSPRCRMTLSAPGDGPCYMQMEMAAGGDREAVNAAHLNDDPHDPLVRAVRAIGCTVGTMQGSVGGATAAMCQDSCSRSDAATSSP